MVLLHFFEVGNQAFFLNVQHCFWPFLSVFDGYTITYHAANWSPLECTGEVHGFQICGIVSSSSYKADSDDDRSFDLLHADEFDRLDKLVGCYLLR